MWTFWLTWSLLTCAAALLCLTGCLVPSWMKGSVHVSAESLQNDLLVELGVDAYAMSSSLGLYRRCVYPVYVHSGSDEPGQIPRENNTPMETTVNLRPKADLIHLRSTCGHYSFTLIPHMAWRIGLMLLIFASLILIFLTFFLVLSGCYLAVLRFVGVHRTCQILLLIAGSLAFASCGIYPLGWHQNTEVQQICGDRSSSYRLGRCQIGWAYMTTLFGGFLAVASAALPSLCLHHRISENVGSQPRCCPSSSVPCITSSRGFGEKYQLNSSSGIPLAPLISRPPDGAPGACSLTPGCSPALAHQQLVGPPTVFLCSNMTPMSQQGLLTQAHSIYSQFTNTSSLGGSSNELGQRPLVSS